MSMGGRGFFFFLINLRPTTKQAIWHCQPPSRSLPGTFYSTIQGKTRHDHHRYTNQGESLFALKVKTSERLPHFFAVMQAMQARAPPPLAVLVVLLAVAGLGLGDLNGSSAAFLWHSAGAGEVPVEYLLLRREVTLAQPAAHLASAVVEVTALQFDFKVLSSYKLWVNGQPISNGPGRDAHCMSHLRAQDAWRSWHCNETAQGYDTVDVTSAMRHGGGGGGPGAGAGAGEPAPAPAVLALQCWSADGRAEHGKQGGVMLLLTLRYTDGTQQTVATEAAGAAGAGQPWMAFNATPAFHPGGRISNFQPSENIIMALWPAGWRLPGYAATAAGGWLPPVVSSVGQPSKPFARKAASAVVQRYRPAAALTPFVPSNCSGYRYRVDMGRELQGGLQLSINGTGFENRSFLVRLGETLLANGSVREHMTAGCNYEERWTLTGGLNVFDMGQEYAQASATPSNNEWASRQFDSVCPPARATHPHTGPRHV